MKRRILFFPFDLFSHYLRCVQLGEAVREEYDVFVIASRDPRSNQRVRDRGFTLVEGQTVDAARMSRLESKLDHSWLSQDELEPIFLDHVRVIHEIQPDVVVSDFSVTLPMAAEFTGTPCYALLVGHLSQHYRFFRKAPDVHPGIQWLHRLHCPRWLVNALSRIGEKWELRSMHRGVRAIRKKYFLRQRAHYLDEIEGDFNFITDIEDFSPMKNLPGNFTYIGPVFNQEPGEERSVLSRLDPGKKTVLITLGTFWKSEDLYSLFNDPAFRVYNVVLAGTPDTSLSPEIIVKPFVNLEALLPRTDVVVCHGGDATVYQCLSHGVPLLGLPFHGEQTWSLQRVARFGLGEEISHDIPAHQLASKVRYWIDRKNKEPDLFNNFAGRISLSASLRRFKESLLHLNERRYCVFCRVGTFETSPEVANVPSDVRRFRNEYFTVWRCGTCGAIHSLRTLDMGDYYKDYPYDAIQSNPYVNRAVRHLARLLRREGVTERSRLLLSAPFGDVHARILRKTGFSNIDVLPRPRPGEPPPPLPKGSYDAVVLLATLEDLEHPGSFLRDAAASLCSGGRLVVQSPEASRIDLSQVLKHRHDLHQPFHLHIYSQNTLLRLVRGAGLGAARLERRHFWDTLWPFVNLRALHALSDFSDQSVDSTVSPSQLKFTRWWHFPAFLFFGFFGGIFRKKVWMWGVFKTPGN